MNVRVICGTDSRNDRHVFPKVALGIYMKSLGDLLKNKAYTQIKYHGNLHEYQPDPIP